MSNLLDREELLDKFLTHLDEFVMTEPGIAAKHLLNR